MLLFVSTKKSRFFFNAIGVFFFVTDDNLGLLVWIVAQWYGIFLGSGYLHTVLYILVTNPNFEFIF
jgi:hypothetical protein